MSEKMTEHCLLREMQGRMSIGARNVVLALITERDQLEERMAAMEGALRAALGLECASVADLGDGATGPACAICGSPFGCNENCPGYDVWREIQAALDGTTTSQEGEDHE